MREYIRGDMHLLLISFLILAKPTPFRIPTSLPIFERSLKFANMPMIAIRDLWTWNTLKSIYVRTVPKKLLLCRALLVWTTAQRTAAAVPCSLSATLRKQSRPTPSAWTRSSRRSGAILCCMILTVHPFSLS